MRRIFYLDREWSDKFTQDEYLNAFFYHGSQGALAAVRFDRWKMHLHPNLQLFDIVSDPGERNEIKATWPTAAQRQLAALKDVEAVSAWEIKTKLRGMVIQFQREMNK